jgi:hypothetical protein
MELGILLFKLNQDLFTELLTNWFGSHAITVLDTALCNTGLRTWWLNSLSSILYIHNGCCKFFNRHQRTQENYFFNQWIVLRKITIMTLKIETTDILTGEFEELFTDKLQNLTLNFLYGEKNRLVEEGVKVCSLKHISTKFFKLRNLEFFFETDGNEFEVINFINNNLHLRSLQCYYDSSLGYKCLQAISKSCAHIQELHFHHMALNIKLTHIVGLLKMCKLIKFITLETYNDKVMFRLQITNKNNFRMCCVRLTGFDDNSEQDKCTFLESLSAINVVLLKDFSITDGFIKRSLQSFTGLKCLTLDGCGNLFSSFSLIELISHCKTLTRIHLIRCCHLSNIDLISILTVKGNVFDSIGISRHKYLDLTTLCAIVAANTSLLSHIYVCKCDRLEHEACDEDYNWVELNLKMYNSKIKMYAW